MHTTGEYLQWNEAHIVNVKCENLTSIKIEMAIFRISIHKYIFRMRLNDCDERGIKHNLCSE